MNIINYYFDNAHDIENLDKVLLQLQLRFSELTGQEELLSQLYEKTLNEELAK